MITLLDWEYLKDLRSILFIFKSAVPSKELVLNKCL